MSNDAGTFWNYVDIDRTNSLRFQFKTQNILEIVDFITFTSIYGSTALPFNFI